LNEQTRITIAPPDESTIYAARHLDLTEGRVQVGTIADASTRAAINRVIDYIAAAHNSPAAPLPSIHANDVQGFCPACTHPTLQVGDGGHLVCVLMDCPKPEAADELLHGVPACNAPGPWGDAHACQLPADHRGDHEAHDGCGWVDEQAAAQHPEPVTTEPASNDWPSRRAGLRNEIAAALEAADYSGTMRRGDLADSIMPVFYRAWPWLQAEAEDAADIARLRADKTALQAALTDTLTVRRQHIGRITRRAAELEAERDRLTDELRQYAEVESADAAAGSYAHRAERAEQQRDQLAATLTEVLAAFHPVHTADRRTVKGHTARVTPADHKRWTAMCGQQSEPDAWTPPPPGSTAEQLPETLLALIRHRLPDYTSTACQTADTLACTATHGHPLYDEIREHAERLHSRCRLNMKFTGQLCACGCHPPKEQP